jgi:8-oxo-dGTP pyrophosphatase MutT (NUDIX family)
MMPAPRHVALAIIRRPKTGELLVFEGRDPSRDLTYHRPLGGGIEPGERVEDTVRRELMEEIGVPITVVRQLGSLDCRFVAGGKPKHEIVFLAECVFENAADYERDWFHDMEGNGEHGVWRRMGDSTVLFPEELLVVLASDSALIEPGAQETDAENTAQLNARPGRSLGSRRQ